jgi:transposase-like protein
LPKKVTIDKSGSNLAALEAVNAQVDLINIIYIRQIKYPNNIVEQDHRAVKRLTRPMMGFKDYDSAKATLAGIELCHMIKKRQFVFNGTLSSRDQFFALAY